MTEKELIAIINAYRADSLGQDDGELAAERAAALDRYNGRPYGDEVEGRSQVVDRSLMEAVDWAMPHLMRIFLASGSIADFAPVGQEDEADAQQESDYVNHVMMQENAGFMVLHDAVKDTLLLKNGYTKEFWEEEKKTEEEEYEGVTAEQVALMYRRLVNSGAEVEILGSESRIAAIEVAGQTIDVPVFDFQWRIVKNCGRAVWDAVPAEEIRVSKKCRGSLRDSPFTEHVTRKTRSDLIAMGMDAKFVMDLAPYMETSNTSQELARDSSDDESDGDGKSSGDKTMEEIEFCEAYLHVDWDGDNVAELRRVVTCSGQIPPGEEWNKRLHENPATGWVAKRMPHRHIGQSLYDELKDINQIITVLKRQLLDNAYSILRGERVVNERANLPDFMSTSVGSVKRIKGSEPVQNAVMDLSPPPIIGQILPVLGYFEDSKQRRSGIDATTGVDADVLQQTTKGAFMENMNRLGAKLEMMARLLAESGVKESVLKMHAILRRHQDIPKQVQLRGKWVTVNPRDWKERMDVRVKVGLGTGNEEEKRMKLGMLAQLQSQLLQLLVGAPPVVYAKAYALFEDLAKTLGAEMPEKYAVAPNSPEHEQILAERQQAQQRGDPRMAIEAQKVQQQGALEQQRMAMQAEVDRNRQEMEARQHAAKMAQEQQLAQFEAMLKAHSERESAARDMAFQKWKAELDAAVKIQTANIASKSKMNDAATATATAEIASEVTQPGMTQPNPPVDDEGMQR